MPKADAFAGKGSFGARLKARREAMEAGREDMATEAFERGSWKDLSVDNVKSNEKTTYEDVDDKIYLR